MAVAESAIDELFESIVSEKLLTSAKVDYLAAPMDFATEVWIR